MKAELSVPNDLNEISLKQYQHYLKIAPDIDGLFLEQKTIEIFCRVELSSVVFIKKNFVSSIVKDINAMFEEQKRPFYQTFTIKDQEFGFIPDLENMSFGEFGDLDGYITNWEDMHKAMAVMYRPIEKKDKAGKYIIKEYMGSDDYSEIMKYAPLGVVFGAMVFFWRLGNELLKATKSYLVDQVGEILTANDPNSMQTGDGISPSMLLLKEMLDDSTTLQGSQYLPLLPS